MVYMVSYIGRAHELESSGTLKIQRFAGILALRKAQRINLPTKKGRPPLKNFKETAINLSSMPHHVLLSELPRSDKGSMTSHVQSW